MVQDDDFTIFRTTTAQNQDVIIISDDEDVENRPPNPRRRRSRPRSIDSSRSSSPTFLGSIAHVPDRSQRHGAKRLKAHRNHLPTVEKTWKPPLSDHGDEHATDVDPFTHLDLLAFEPEISIQTQQLGSEGLLPRGYSQQGRFQPKNTNNSLLPDVHDRCPYYFDQILEVKMYCGPGFTKFPIVFDATDNDHQRVCNNWDAKMKKQREEDQLYITSLTDGVNPFAITKSNDYVKLELQCLREVQDVFPQISRQFVLEKYRASFDANAKASHGGAPPAAIEIISEIAELDSFPREEPSTTPTEGPPLPEDGTGVTVVYDKSIPKDESYNKEALRILASHFTHIPTIAISRTLQEKLSLFSTFIYLSVCEARYFELPRDQRCYVRSKQPRHLLEKKYQRGFSESRDSKLYGGLVNELQAAKQHEAREIYRLQKAQDMEAAEAQNLLFHKIEGSLIECQTCFDDEIPMNRALMCEGDIGHFFCFGCVARLAESQIGAMKHEMMCMDSSGCKAILSMESVGRAVSTKVVDKLAFYQQQAEISAANLEGLEQCPHCEYKAICDPIEDDCIFMCLNPDCGKNTCRKCHEFSHLPKNCEEAKTDRGLSARHVIEEARSEAMMRKCPKCKAKIIKELGCNKMVCSCGNMMCYVCQLDISGQGKDQGYQHFHKAGSKCPLYDNAGAERHDQDADAAEEDAIKRVKAQDGNEDLADEELRIETGKEKDKKKKSKKLPPGANLNVYPALADHPILRPLLVNLNGYLVPRVGPGLDHEAILREARNALRGQHFLPNQERIDRLRDQGEVLQRQRQVLENRRINNALQAARETRRVAHAGQVLPNDVGGQGFQVFGAPNLQAPGLNLNVVAGHPVRVADHPFMPAFYEPAAPPAFPPPYLHQHPHYQVPGQPDQLQLPTQVLGRRRQNTINSNTNFN